MTTPRDAAMAAVDNYATGEYSLGINDQKATDQPVIAGLNQQVADLQSQLAAAQTALEQAGGSHAPLAWDDLPMVKYTDLYQTGDTAATVLGKRVTQKCYVDVTGVDAEFVDFPYGNHSLSAPLVAGLWSPNPTQARFTLRANSSTKASLVPAQSAGGNNPLTVASFGAVKLSGVTFVGTDQPPAWGHPHNYSGITLYRDSGSVIENCRLVSMGRGDYNAPPGETQQLNLLRSVNPVIRNVEIDGGMRGANVGGYAFTNALFEDCWIHDSLVSGFACGSAGNPAPTQTLGNGLTVRRCRIASNANHVGVAKGQMFSGLNFEGMGGFVHLYDVDIWIENQAKVAQPHFRFGNSVVDCLDIRIVDPVWHGDRGGSPGWANGCLVVAVPTNYAGALNKQTTLPVVTLRGVTLTPVERAQAATADPATNYVVTR